MYASLLDPGSSDPHGRLDQMQNPMEQRFARLSRLPDINDARMHELVLEDIDDSLQSFIVQRPQHVIDQEPRGCLQNDAGNGQSELLVLAQFTIPTPGDLQQWNQSLQSEPPECATEGCRLKPLDFQGIG